VRVLLVTGQLAKDIVEQQAKENAVETVTLPLKIAVAAFLTPNFISNELKKLKLTDFNMILVPGFVRGDVSEITVSTGIPTFKGPRYAADLSTVLDSLCDVQLSTTIPACDLIREKLVAKAFQEIQKTESERDKLLLKPGNMLIGNLAVGKDFPMRVLAEIVDAAVMDKETIQNIAKQFVEVGADIIDIGMIAGESNPEKAGQMIHWVKEVVDVPVSIDTLDSAEIKAAIKAGAELVLSGDAGNIDEIASYAKNVAVVIIPTNQQQGYFPKKTTDRVKFIEEIIIKAKKLGITKCLADLIVEPLDILESFIAFKDFASRNPHIPLFVGISNVTELFDADSIGLNALLTRLSSEVGGSMLLATEKSPKAKGTVREEVTAAKMMFLAKKRISAPKDLGLDLLVLKDKKNYEEQYDKSLENTSKVIDVTKTVEPTLLDSAGQFKIYVDRNTETLVSVHYLPNEPTKPVHVIKGKTSDDICAKITELALLTQLDHAAYLGRELVKAEIALKTGKAYVQDADLFK